LILLDNKYISLCKRTTKANQAASNTPAPAAKATNPNQQSIPISRISTTAIRVISESSIQPMAKSITTAPSD
jgi:hypothetical protein